VVNRIGVFEGWTGPGRRDTIIEPYVRAIDLQTEIIQQGFNCHIVSSGANHSLLASHAATWGYGVSGAATSFSGCNLLGVEWVLPTGEVVTIGSAGCD
jgi:glycolate oxidase